MSIIQRQCLKLSIKPLNSYKKECKGYLYSYEIIFMIESNLFYSNEQKVIMCKVLPCCSGYNSYRLF